MTTAQLDGLQIALLAFVQGLTEFLPISSSAHLLLPGILFSWPDQGLTFDVAVHLGSLLAVLAYFSRDLRRLFLAWLGSLGGGPRDGDARLAWLLLLATVPGGLAGLLLNDWIERFAREPSVIASTSIVFALALWWADRFSRRTGQLAELTLGQALFIGVAQALALIPGTSRSGVTMTAALMCQLNRQEAARFSFLMAIPIIAASGLLRARDLLEPGQGELAWWPLLLGAGISALTAFACIHYFLRLIERIGFLPFIVYRVLLGGFLLGLVWIS